MHIGVISDTHGKIEEAKKVLIGIEDVDLWIHLGDYYRDANRLETMLQKKVIAIKGNCDAQVEGEEEKIITLGSYKLLLVHGHQYGVKWGLTRLYYRALEVGCNVALFGHTHIPVNEKHDEILFMNPGSLSFPRGGVKASWGMIEIQKDRMHSKIITDIDLNIEQE